MYYLFSCESEQRAIQFRDYVAQHYQTQLVITKQTHFAVFVAESAVYLQQIVADAQLFCANPLAEKFQTAAWANSHSSVNFNFYAIMKESLHKIMVNVQQQGKFTCIIAFLCFVCFLLAQYDSQLVFDWLHFPANQAERWQIWRYFSHSMLHISPWHLSFNLAWWWIFANAIERYFSTTKLMALFLCAALCSGIGQDLATGPLFLGLSGVVYAVLSYVWIIDRYNPHYFQLPPGFIYFLLIGIASGFIMPLLFAVNVGNTAHIVGAICGILFAFITLYQQKKCGVK